MKNHIHILPVKLPQRCDSQFANLSIGSGGGLFCDVVSGHFECINHDLKSRGTNDANGWDGLDPATKFPIPPNATCDQLTALYAQLEAEQASVAAQDAGQPQKAKTAAGAYIAKIISYQASVNALLTIGDCEQKKIAAQDQLTICEGVKAAQAAAAALNSQQAAQGLGIISPISIALTVGVVLFIGIIVVVIKGNKNNPLPIAK